jgi:hypothetical protein
MVDDMTHSSSLHSQDIEIDVLDGSTWHSVCQDSLQGGYALHSIFSVKNGGAHVIPTTLQILAYSTDCFVHVRNNSIHQQWPNCSAERVAHALDDFGHLSSL